MFYKKIVYDEDLVNEFLYLLSMPEYFVPKGSTDIFFHYDKNKVFRNLWLKE